MVIGMGIRLEIVKYRFNRGLDPDNERYACVRKGRRRVRDGWI